MSARLLSLQPLFWAEMNPEEGVYAILNERWSELFPGRTPPTWPGQDELAQEVYSTTARIVRLRKKLFEERTVLECLRRLATELNVDLDPETPDVLQDMESTSESNLLGGLKASTSITSIVSACSEADGSSSGKKKKGYKGVGRRFSVLRKNNDRKTSRTSGSDTAGGDSPSRDAYAGDPENLLEALPPSARRSSVNESMLSMDRRSSGGKGDFDAVSIGSMYDERRGNRLSGEGGSKIFNQRNKEILSGFLDKRFRGAKSLRKKAEKEKLEKSSPDVCASKVRHVI